MDYRKFGSKVVLRVDRGEEVVASMKKVCEELGIKAASAMGIGAADQITVGSYDTVKQEYTSQEFKGEYEIVNMTGTITNMGDELYLHFHITLTDHHMHAVGGHLNSAIISGTGEIVMDIIDGHIDRSFDSNVGLNTYKFD